MQPVNLFDFAAQQARWLSVRQSTVAGNIANVHTPGYAAMEVEPFEKVLANTRVAIQTTHPQHVSMGTTGEAFVVREDGSNAPLLPSENTVVLESELMKAGEVRRSLELNTGVVKAFHRMLLMTAKG